LSECITQRGWQVLDRTGDERKNPDINEFIRGWRGAAVVTVWDIANHHNPYALEISAIALWDDRLISVTFDGARLEYGFGNRACFDFSVWDGGADSEPCPQFLLEVQRILDVSDVFVSYAREDAEIAGRLCAQLGNHGFSVWWDAALVAGRTFADVIDQKLSQVRAVVVLWTARSIQSAWVTREARQGMDRGILVPLSIGVDPPEEFAHLHTAALDLDDLDARQQLTARLRELTRQR
jgi:hypothetical protein